MPLITTIQQVKEVLRISSVDSESALPDIEAAEQKYIIPKIGQEQYDDLLAAYEANTLTGTQATLLKKIQKPLAAFAYHDDLALQHAMITDAGVRRTTTDNMPSAFRWEFDGVKESLANKAHQGMEALLQWLEENKASFPLYEASDAYAYRNKFLLKNALDFNTHYRIFQPYRTYEALLAVMEDVEMMYVERVIGAAFFLQLKTLPTPSVDEKQVIILLKKAIANLTIHHAFEKLSVRMTEAGPTIYDRYADRGDSERAQPSGELMSFVMKATERDGQTYLKQAKAVLDDKASPTTFALYFASPFYSAPADPVDPNENLKSFTFIR